MKIRKALLGLGVALAILGGGLATTVKADKGDYGVDWSIYQGANGKWGYAKDKFAIAQIGGTTNGWSMYDQWTYKTQVASTIAQGKRAHTYIWWQNVTSNAQADSVLNYFLPKVQTPKGSIVALDVESGAQNTQAIAHAIQRIKDAGYTPMVYGYKNYLVNNTDLKYLSSLCQLWLAEYPNYNVTPTPNYNFFPSFDNIGIFQFTSTYVAGGLDGDVDLTGITDNGYRNGNPEKPKTQTPAVKAGIVANNTPKKNITAGYSVKVNYSASRWATGEGIPSWVKGKTYTVIQASGNKVLLSGIMSWINKSDVEILATAKQNEKPIAEPKIRVGGGSSAPVTTYRVQYGDNLSSIASRYNTTWQNLQALNGLSNPNYLYVGQILKVSGTAPVQRKYVVRYGDNLSSIAYRLGTTVYALQSKNGIRNANLIYTGQVLNY